jgi:hypothetical protein
VRSVDIKRKGLRIVHKKKSVVTLNKAPRLISEKTSFAYIEAYKTLRTNFNFIAARRFGAARIDSFDRRRTGVCGRTNTRSFRVG